MTSLRNLTTAGLIPVSPAFAEPADLPSAKALRAALASLTLDHS